MDPFSLAMLVGPALGAGANILGGLMNTSSTQAINAANLQQQTWSAQGGYLPGLVANANKAGLNPLAVLGSRGPNMAVQVGDQPGAGLQAAGRDLASMDPFTAKMKEYQLENMRAEVMQKAAVNKNTMIEGAIKQKALSDLYEGRTVSGPEPAARTTLSGAGIDFMSGKTLGDFFPKWDPLPRSNEPWSWMDYGKRLWSDPGTVFR